jgi:hypothetical protein
MPQIWLKSSKVAKREAKMPYKRATAADAVQLVLG